ncbi:MAG: NusG domain II-containing protein [Oscillospiraceae bacterium]|nr:NusG domain II-containing protein [Oscillospiraceae bacterium]
MKTKTWIMLLAAVLAVCLGLSIPLLMPGEEASYAQIYSDGQLMHYVDLRVDQEFHITTYSGGTNTVTVKDGKIAVTEANCPDHYCMDRGFCNSGAQIVCLPNRLVIRFVGEQPIDAVVG